MNTVKALAKSSLGLLLALIVLMLFLRLLKKVPLVGPLAADAQNLATTGTING
jgi:hypothetical protein